MTGLGEGGAEPNPGGFQPGSQLWTSLLTPNTSEEGGGDPAITSFQAGWIPQGTALSALARTSAWILSNS